MLEANASLNKHLKLLPAFSKYLILGLTIFLPSHSDLLLKIQTDSLICSKNMSQKLNLNLTPATRPGFYNGLIISVLV
jgi:hypothetical protein